MKAIFDERKILNPDEVVAVPNDLVDKYMKLFIHKKSFLAVMDLISQSYKAGLQIGREEKIKDYEDTLDKIYQ